MDLVADLGLTEDQGRSYMKFIGTLLAIPVVLFGLCSVLTVAGFFVLETWNGFLFLHTVGSFNEIFIEWITLVAMLGAPLAAMIISLFARLDNWWAISFTTWFASMTIFFLLFVFVVIYNEIFAAWVIIQELQRINNSNSQYTKAGLSQLFSFLCEAVTRRQYSLFGGKTQRIRVSSHDEDVLEPSHNFCMRWYRNVTLSKCCGCFFEHVDPPEKIFTIEEILGRRRFITRHNWSVEKILCSNRRTQNVAVVRGPSALKRSQIISSIVCVSVAVTAAVLLVLGFMVWLDKPAVTMVLFVLLVCCICFPRFLAIPRFLKAYSQIQKEKDDDFPGSSPQGLDLDDGIYQAFETFRVSRPTKVFRVLLFTLNIGLFFIWPTVSLINIGENKSPITECHIGISFDEPSHSCSFFAMLLLGNYKLLSLFILLGIWSYLRYFINPCILLQDLGTFEVIGKSDSQKWKVQSRISTIIMNVTRSPGTSIWMWSFLLIIVVSLLFSLDSIAYKNGSGVDSMDLTDDNYYIQEGINHLFWAPMNLTTIGDFEYPPLTNMQYPTCQLFKGLEIPNSTSTALADYAFLATLIYQAPETLQSEYFVGFPFFRWTRLCHVISFYFQILWINGLDQVLGRSKPI
jgi:hypothetical protein